ncbi:MAG: hypothetical protein EOQ39_22125 [Mesorhizobium sp.]|nr:MAG: hypothetical protein EOQ37_27175 [Mesorhizobium sp.]RWB12870.1 MAG: hypothetical protein EOQ39_22125 [Mesorhizobium sp.]
MDVYIEKLDGQPRVRVVDNGIGMSLDVIKNYFLNAGASYRSSYAWQNAHVDDDGRSRIARSGRFGVGALAAFPIGPRISLTTKQWSSANGEGFSFSCGLHDKEIQLEKRECPFGTDISIDTSVDTYNKIVQLTKEVKNFYQFDDLVVLKFHVTDDERTTIEQCNNYDKDSLIGTFNTEKFPSVSWGKAKYPRYSTNFVNGIAVRPIADRYRAGGLNNLYETGPLFVEPSFDELHHSDSSSLVRSSQFWVSVEDRDAFSPLNLARTSFNVPDDEITLHIDDHLFSSLLKTIDENSEELSKMSFSNDGFGGAPETEANLLRVRRSGFV